MFSIWQIGGLVYIFFQPAGEDRLHGQSKFFRFIAVS